MKKILWMEILWVGMFLVLLNSVSAQNIGINLIEYHPESNYARIQITNNEGKDLSEVTIQVDSARKILIADLLEQGGVMNTVLNVPPGERLVTVESKEGVKVSKKVYFSLSKAEVQEIKEKEQEQRGKEAELMKQAQENLEIARREIQKERERAVALGVVKEGPNKLLILGVIGVIIGIIILYWLIKRGTPLRPS